MFMQKGSMLKQSDLVDIIGLFVRIAYVIIFSNRAEILYTGIDKHKLLMYDNDTNICSVNCFS